ncbi:hypothetical protein DFJ73DRAFT_803827 [Zopfochytrium polystomum]|nr:hypothetical protein DFJ73DRAFT_803827 [Zopfochytrium polystomum]
MSATTTTPPVGAPASREVGGDRHDDDDVDDERRRSPLPHAAAPAAAPAAAAAARSDSRSSSSSYGADDGDSAVSSSSSSYVSYVSHSSSAVGGGASDGTLLERIYSDEDDEDDDNVDDDDDHHDDGDGDHGGGVEDNNSNTNNSADLGLRRSTSRSLPSSHSRSHLLNHHNQQDGRRRFRLLSDFVALCATYPPGPSVPATLAILAYLVLVPAVWWVMSALTTMPAAVVPLSETELSGAFSGAAAWEHLQTIAAEPHMYNSDANLRVRAFLIEKLQEFDRLAASRGRPGFLDIAEDDVNVTAATGKFFFESNNVIVRINGANAANATAAAAATKDRHALLVSAHYDSTPVSYGVTDDGIAIAVMLEFVRTLIYSRPLQHDVVFNFNNGEEMFLPGATAFVYHPWFAGIKAFINLEGTGSAPGTRSMLFRTNSPALVKAWKQSAPFPHASVLFNDLTPYVASETDYRVYTTYGGLQGVDVAFYTYRYLYHTPLDNLDGSWAISAQHMGDNLRGFVTAVCRDDPQLLPSLAASPEQGLAKPMDDPLPAPNFVFYDLFGQVTLTPGWAFKLTLALLVAIVLGSTAVKLTREGSRMGSKRVFKMFIRPTLEAYALVILSCAAALLAVLALSWCKAKVNPGSTYGLPAANLAWIAAAVAAAFAACQHRWPAVAAALRLRKPAARMATLRRLPTDDGSGAMFTAPPRGMRRSGGGGRSDPARAPLLPASPRAGSRPHPVQKWLAYGLLGFWTTLLTAGLYFAARWNWHGFYFVSDWAFFAVLSVAVTQALAPMVLKWWKAEAVVVEEPTTVGSGGVLEAGGRRGRRGVRAGGGGGGVSLWKRKVVKFFERQMWGLQLVLSSAMPALLTFDILMQFSTILPTAISDGAAEYNIDLIFGALFVLLFVNLLPALQLASRSSIGMLFVAIFVPAYLASVFCFPFDATRPQKYVFTQTWNITDSPDNPGTPSYPNTTQLTLSPLTTMSAARFQSHMARAPVSLSLDCAIPPAPPVAPGVKPRGAPRPACTATVPAVPFGGWGYTYDKPSQKPLLELTLSAPHEVPGTGGVVEVEGTLVGTPGSRICTLQPSIAAAAAGAGVVDPSLALWVLDADESGGGWGWRVAGDKDAGDGDARRDPRNATARRPETYEYGYGDAPVVVVARRGTVSPPSSASPAAGLPRIRVPFLVRYNSTVLLRPAAPGGATTWRTGPRRRARLSGLEYVEAACYHGEVEDVGGLWGTLQARQGGWMKPTHGKFGGVVVVRRVKVDVAA